jgi:glycosyltransferase involved in cell wall biosynthesis
MTLNNKVESSLAVNSPLMGELNSDKKIMPLVTFALFSYNQEPYIRDALEAALAQDYKALEIIISDDFSTDKTFEIIRDVASSYLGQHKIILNRNSKNLGVNGFGAHVNKVLEMAVGELIIFAAGDDISLPYRVSSLVKTWLNAGKPSGSLHSAVEILSDNNKLTGNTIHGNAHFSTQTLVECIRNGATGLLGCSHAITSDVYKKFGPLLKGVVAEDRCLAFRSFLIGKILYDPEILVKYRIHENNMSGANIFESEIKWNRWIDGIVMCYKSFNSDYRFYCGDGAIDEVILKELGAGITRAEKSRYVNSNNIMKRLMSINNYTYSLNISDRVVVTLRILKLEGSFLYSTLSFVYKYFKKNN